MVELTEETIDVIKKIKDAINKTSFRINSFEVNEDHNRSEYIQIDIRKD